MYSDGGRQLTEPHLQRLQRLAVVNERLIGRQQRGVESFADLDTLDFTFPSAVLAEIVKRLGTLWQGFKGHDERVALYVLINILTQLKRLFGQHLRTVVGDDASALEGKRVAIADQPSLGHIPTAPFGVYHMEMHDGRFFRQFYLHGFQFIHRGV